VALTVQLVGAALVLLAFGLAQAHVLSTTSRRYLLLNVAGSAALAASALAGRQWGFVVLNATWCAVAVVGLVRGRATPRAPSPP
jgi:hypothetical protein